MATSDATLELLLNRATDPSMKEEDLDRITEFCDRVNIELEGPLHSTRFIAHKIQSPQEKEALFALTTLEACVKNCGRYFHQEIGKFRFLNEIIKVVSPKYLGNRTTETVKKRCIEIIYSWSKGLSHEPKISEAYKMLKTQGIITKDPVHIDKTFTLFPPPKPRKADFEDDEKAKTLERLLKSKNPDDLQAANRLIKNMVKEDMEKIEKKSRRINELESVRNQVKLLTEMIGQFSAASSKEEREMMQELFDNLEKQRPNLFRLASDTDETDNEGINEILQANDSVTRAMTSYKQTVEREKPAENYATGDRDSSLLDLGFESGMNKTVTAPSTPQSASSTLLENDFKMMGFSDMNELGNLFSGGSVQQQQTSMGQRPGMGQPMGAGANTFGQPAGFAGLTTASPGWSQRTPTAMGDPPAYNAISHNVQLTSQSNTTPATDSVFQQNLTTTTNIALADLDILDKSLQDYKLHKEMFPVKTVHVKVPLNQLATNRNSAAQVNPQTVVSDVLTPGGQVPLVPTSAFGVAQSRTETDHQTNPPHTNGVDFTPMVSAAPEPVPELLPLTDVFVPLETIQPAPNIPSVTAYDMNNLKVAVHFATARPRQDVLTMVVSTLSTNTNPITGFVFQAAVPKTMKVKLQPPSASDFPAYNPILPPAAITQVMLVANPRKELVRLKYKLAYTLEGKLTSDVGDIEDIPIQ